MHDNSLFAGRTIAIATMHQKETVIAPLLIKKLETLCVVPEINTDTLGTFSGEIDRLGTPLETARKKCEMAMEVMACDLAIASEGSFGVHPLLPFAHANDEIVMLLDRKNNLEIVGRELTTATNFQGATIKSLEEAEAFATQALFPSHGLILRKKEHTSPIVKGLVDPIKFEKMVGELLERNAEVWIETDMRAMHNPTRMLAIEKATRQLIQKLESTCPSCESPGFWVSEACAGLPCEQCYLPTKSTLEHIYKCPKCLYSERKSFPNSKRFEDPMYCDFCNP